MVRNLARMVIMWFLLERFPLPLGAWATLFYCSHIIVSYNNYWYNCQMTLENKQRRATLFLFLLSYIPPVDRSTSLRSKSYKS